LVSNIVLEKVVENRMKVKKSPTYLLLRLELIH
jgi:hypothetical protein